MSERGRLKKKTSPARRRKGSIRLPCPGPRPKLREERRGEEILDLYSRFNTVDQNGLKLWGSGAFFLPPQGVYYPVSLTIHCPLKQIAREGEGERQTERARERGGGGGEER